MTTSSADPNELPGWSAQALALNPHSQPSIGSAPGPLLTLEYT
jgi:hypothetical protein